MYDVITIGAAVIDAFMRSNAAKQIHTHAFPGGEGECFALGSKMDVDEFVVSTGGGATNAAATFVNLGFSSAPLARIGCDFFGWAVQEDLKQRNISTDLLIACKKYRTGFSTILLTNAGERTVLCYRGASERYFWSEFHTAKIKAKWFYVSSLAGHLDIATKLFQCARKNKTNIFWNPGAKELTQGMGALKPLMKYVTIMMVNREEAALLTELPARDIRGMLSLLAHEVPHVLITDGPNGSYYTNGKEYYHGGTRNIQAINATGAGDGFGSGFLVGMMVWNDPLKSLQLATLNGEGVIQKMGAKEGLLKRVPSRKKLNEISVTLLSV